MHVHNVQLVSYYSPATLKNWVGICIQEHCADMYHAL